MWVKKRLAMDGLMRFIVAIGAVPLNAHSCRCLAHFSMVLENMHRNTHTVFVKKSIRSGVK